MLISSLSFAQTKATQRLFVAIEKNNIDQAVSAIRDGADVNGVDNLEAPTTTVLTKAVKMNRLEIVKVLLENKADVNQRRPIDLYSGLMVAAKYDLAPIAKLLLQHGADVNLYTVAMRTALHVAALHDSLSVAEVLMRSNEIDVNFSNAGGLCALAVAARQDNKSIVFLLKNQSGVKASSPRCIEKALHVAALNGNDQVVRILNRN